jgi:hypothetical protein
MADISMLSRLLNGLPRDVDIAANTLVTTSIKVGGGISNTELTKAILDRLVALQNGSDVDATYHTHDGRYFTETELSSTGATSGADRIGTNNTPTNYSPAAARVQDHLEAIDAALSTAGGSAFDDSIFQVYDNGDITKIMMFEVSGIATGTTRTITMPDANVNLADVNNAILRNGSRAFTAAQSMGTNKLTNLAAGTTAGDAVRYEQAILASGVNAFAADQSFGGFKATNLADPVGSQDAVTLSYLVARLNGLTPKAPAKAATTANITLSGAQTIDGVSIVAGNRVLVKNQTAPEENGIYVASASAWARSTDMDSLTPFDEFNGAWVAIQQGTQAGQVFVQYGTVATVDTDAINFSYFNPIAGLIGGDMITFSGSTFSVDLATTSGLKSTNPGNVAGQLTINVEASNPTLQINGSNELAVKYAAGSALTQGAGGLAVLVDGSTLEISTSIRIKDAGVTLAKLASNSVDENKIVSTTYSASGAITGGSGTKVAVQVDNSSIEISSNALRVKSTAYDQATITGGSGSAAAVQSAPLLQETMIAGESFAANRSFLVRMALNGQTAGRIYKADKAAGAAGAETNTIYVIGIAQNKTGSAITAGNPIPVVKWGNAVLQSSDTGFTATQDEGLPVYLGAAGAFTLTPSTTSNDAIVKVGTVRNVDAASAIEMSAPQIMGINA